MELTPEQIAEFDDRGLLVFPGLLQPQEVAQLTVRLPELYSRTGPEVVREKQSNNIRLVYGTHDFCKPFSTCQSFPACSTPCVSCCGERPTCTKADSIPSWVSVVERGTGIKTLGLGTAKTGCRNRTV